MFDRIHCLCQIHGSFDRFIGEFDRFIDKISRYSSVGNFTIYIFNQMNFNRFLPNSTNFFKNRRTGGVDFLVSADFSDLLNPPAVMAAAPVTSSAAAASSSCARLPSAPLRAPRGAVSFPSSRTLPSSPQPTSTCQSSSSCHLYLLFSFATS
jgi:hypothetical protein